MPPVRVGVLALQGDFAAHLEIFSSLGIEAAAVRRASEMEGLDGLVVPGGESTTLDTLLDLTGLRDPLQDFARKGHLLGTCAGAILMASELENAGGVRALGILDMAVRRNGFGRQVDSFEDTLESSLDLGGTEPLRGVFIRAPRILRTGKSVEIIGYYGKEPVAVRTGGHMALTFHPEIRRDARWHALWVKGLSLTA